MTYPIQYTAIDLTYRGHVDRQPDQPAFKAKPPAYMTAFRAVAQAEPGSQAQRDALEAMRDAKIEPEAVSPELLAMYDEDLEACMARQADEQMAQDLRHPTW
jgi:hypothetical protein